MKNSSSLRLGRRAAETKELIRAVLVKVSSEDLECGIN